MSGEDDGFLQRWARRKARVQSGLPELEPAPVRDMPAQAETATVVAPVALEQLPVAVPAPAPIEVPVPRPTMDDVAHLTRSSDYSRFVGAGVDADVSNAAMKKLFSDPHFNVMDGLDTYIDDYGKPDPIPDAMLRQLNQAKFLRLFDADEDVEAARAGAAPAAAEASTDGALPPAMAQSVRCDEPLASVSLSRPDDDPDLRLQQDDAPGRSGVAPGAGA
jgi:Protein of unknown function (DUF3306)